MNPVRAFSAGFLVPAAALLALLIIGATTLAAALVMVALVVAGFYGILFADSLTEYARRTLPRAARRPQPVEEPPQVFVSHYRNQSWDTPTSPPTAAPLPELVATANGNHLATGQQPVGNWPATTLQPEPPPVARQRRRASMDQADLTFLANLQADLDAEAAPWNGVTWEQIVKETDAARDLPASIDEPLDPLALPLSRRPPLAIQYPLIWRAVREADSLNDAIYAIYGGKKDGARHRWVRQVISYYTDGPGIDDDLPAIFHWRLLASTDHPGAVAGELGIDLDDDQLAELTADLARCVTCQYWRFTSTIDDAGQCAGCCTDL